MSDSPARERKIILASGSPRRRDLLARAGIKFEVLVTNADERVDGDVSPEVYVSIIAERKARAAADIVNEKPFIIIAADTVVEIDGKILGKPKDKEDARAMLKLLGNRWHRVLTGLTVAYDKDGQVNFRREVCVTDVKFKHLSDMDIQSYIGTPEPYDKAGAYAIQGAGAVFVEKINGSRDNVAGLPVDLLIALLSGL